MGAEIEIIAPQQTLEDVERTFSHQLTASGASRIDRMASRPALHRVAPTWLVLAAARAIGTAAWLVPGIRSRATRRTRLLLAADAHRGEVRRLARRQLRTWSAINAAFWRPAMHRRATLEGLEHVRSARAGGRGAILSTIHFGPRWSPFYEALAASGLKIYVSQARRSRADSTAPFGLTMVEGLRRMEKAGHRAVLTGRSFDRLRALLNRGEVCMVYFDVPGDTVSPVVEFAGRSVRLSAGTAGLATATGAAIVPCHTVLSGGRLIARFGAPIEPEGLGTAELHRRLAAVHSSTVTGQIDQARPEGMDLINRAALVSGSGGA